MLRRKRRGVTLLITLSIIAAMFVLIGLLFGYLEQARKVSDSQSALIQADLLRSDLQVLFKRYLGAKPSRETLQTLYTTPLPIYEERGNFGLTLLCRPLKDRIPIGWLALDGTGESQKRFELARKVFDTLVQRYELKDPERLYEMIVQAYKKGAATSFGVEPWLRGAPDSTDPQAFGAVLEEYRFRLDDARTEDVPWDRYFDLRPSGKKAHKLDKEFLAPALVSILYDLDPQLVKEEYTPGFLSRFLSNMGIEDRYSWLNGSFFVNIHCTARYSFREAEYNVSFDYIGERIASFEIQ